MDEIQEAILRLLESQPDGQAINTDEIYAHLNQQNLPIMQGRTQEHVRQLVRSMIKNHNQLIGSRSGFEPNNGYYIIRRQEELIETMMDLISRSRSMLERVESLRTTWNEEHQNERI